MIFGSDPMKTIMDDYLTEYTCGFLNASGGTILIGVQEHKNSKLGHIVGINLSLDERKKLVQKAVTEFSKFYPPVTKSQFRLIFHKVTVPLKLIVKNSLSSDEATNDTFVLLRGKAHEIGKWQKSMDKAEGFLCKVVPVKPDGLCIAAENESKVVPGVFCIAAENEKAVEEGLKSKLNEFIKQNKNIVAGYITESDLKTSFKQLCMIELKVFPSQYPIHLIKPIDAHVMELGNLTKITMEKLMRRFELGKDSQTKFEIERFLNHVEKFEKPGNSYILITSPFDLGCTESDLHGLVLPQWTLAIDFDQNPKQKGHMFHRFKELNDIHQLERERFIKTPQDTKLDLNPEHAICWLAVRGYVEAQKTLSEEG